MSVDITAKKLETANKFWEVCSKAMDELKGGPQVSIFRGVIGALQAASPIWFVGEGGPFFWRNREAIERGDIDFFINLDFGRQRADWIALTNGYGTRLADAFEGNIKDSLRAVKSQPAKAAKLKGLVAAVLRLYASYLQLCQQEAK